MPDSDWAGAQSLLLNGKLLHMESEHCWCEPRLEAALDLLEGEIAGYVIVHNGNDS